MQQNRNKLFEAIKQLFSFVDNNRLNESELVTFSVVYDIDEAEFIYKLSFR